MNRELGSLALAKLLEVAHRHRLGFRNSKQVDPTGEYVLYPGVFELFAHFCHAFLARQGVSEIFYISGHFWSPAVISRFSIYVGLLIQP